MSVVYVIDSISRWLKDEICKDVLLKPMSLDAQDASFDYKLVEPEVWPLYVPTETTKPPEVAATSPAICVQLIDGQDDVFDERRKVKLRLAFSVWNPGIHGPDKFTPTDAENASFGRTYVRGENGTIALNHDGWRDVWNFTDRALRIIENERALAGYPIDERDGVKFGCFSYDGSIADYYPFWFSWIEVSVVEQLSRNFDGIAELL